jgi:hypothetical protein
VWVYLCSVCIHTHAKQARECKLTEADSQKTRDWGNQARVWWTTEHELHFLYETDLNLHDKTRIIFVNWLINESTGVHDKSIQPELLSPFQDIATSSIQFLFENVVIYGFLSGLFDMRDLKYPSCMQINYDMQICMQAYHKLNGKGIIVLLISVWKLMKDNTDKVWKGLQAAIFWNEMSSIY